mmetsp:Transcript_8777/g.21428  ORF Transcript_8777/g.21428 Transcript_8777/m.21428 type:complete len:307 (-) Transcript_8777:389-1309(-)|eukprot:CAMPEP_0197187318 /NCGR_PEP_ID=MMETSP1423-20130617/15654_1 /TAXON_ID=476441 /ORGANISM="Pseudo-nitzschia heimii, Strain UNC1101" /LENGTH=306 /DNA_ID=CAMNT_0042638863 /DNA_START=23 /DNA_END=943 /DNA_ORIENTATION=+
MLNEALATTEISSLTTEEFYASLRKYIDCNKPDPIARRQLERWKMNWSNGSVRENKVISDASTSSQKNMMELLAWSPEMYLGGTLEICGDYVAVTLESVCTWADGDSAKSDIAEDGRLYYTCRLKSGRFIERQNEEAKTERKIRKKMISRLRQDSYITKLLEFKEDNHSSKLCLAQASIYVNSNTFELEERVNVSEFTAEILRRALWPSTTSSLDVVEVILILPSLPCRSSGGVSTGTTRLANRAKLRLLEDAMLDECEKEGDDHLVEDLIISTEIESQQDGEKELFHGKSNSARQEKKKRKGSTT